MGEGLVGVDLPRAHLVPLETSVLNDSLGEVLECYQAGPSSVLAVVEDYDTLCGLNVDPLGLFVVPSSVVIAACFGGPEVDVSIRVFAPRLGSGRRPRDRQRDVRGRSVVGGEGRLPDRRRATGQHARRTDVRTPVRTQRRSRGHRADLLRAERSAVE